MARSGSRAARAAAVLLSVATLAGCAAQPLPAPSVSRAAPAASTASPSTSDVGTATRTASPSAPVSASASTSASASPTPPGASPTPRATSPTSTGVVGFGSIGALTVRMTARQIADRIGATAGGDTGNPSCAAATFTGGSGQDAALAQALSTLAESDGATGRVDVLELGVLRPVDGDAAGLPRTERGIGIGSTAAQVRRAYRGGFTETDGVQGPELLVKGPDGSALVFHVAGETVSGISTGRLPQVRYAEHCG